MYFYSSMLENDVINVRSNINNFSKEANTLKIEMSSWTYMSTAIFCSKNKKNIFI